MSRFLAGFMTSLLFTQPENLHNHKSNFRDADFSDGVANTWYLRVEYVWHVFLKQLAKFNTEAAIENKNLFNCQ